MFVLAANVLSFAIFWVLKLMVFNRLFHTSSKSSTSTSPTKKKRKTAVSPH